MSNVFEISSKLKTDLYTEDYFERGIECRISAYTRYRWIPELTIPMAMTMIDYLGICRGETVLDYGCSMGFLVKAFRMLYRKSYGVDISRYALENAHPDVSFWCRHVDEIYSMGNDYYDFCISKDVFEHIKGPELERLCQTIRTKKLFVIIPLGENGKYVAPANDLDVTHVICKDRYWWERFFTSAGWRVLSFSYRVEGIKDVYEEWEKAFGFFVLEKQKQALCC